MGVVFGVGSYRANVGLIRVFETLLFVSFMNFKVNYVIQSSFIQLVSITLIINSIVNKQ